MRNIATVLMMVGIAGSAMAADADKGLRLAQSHCASYHVVMPGQRNEVAVAAPFDTIGRKYKFAADVIVRAITSPHPRMNFSPRPADAADIAAFIATLK